MPTINDYMTHNQSLSDITSNILTKLTKVLLDESPDMVPFPEYVVNPKTQKLQLPLQLSHFKLAEKILELSQDPQRLDCYSIELHNIVVSKFSMFRFSKELDIVYRKLLAS
jgi:hypothetical protein